MRVQIQGKTFDIALYEDHAFILEYNKYGKRWIKLPLGVIRWVLDVFEHCSSLEDLSFEKRYDFLSWRISTRRNKWGWVLELGVRINGIFYSIFVPGELSFKPWSRFINSFRHVVSGEGNPLKHGIGIHSDPSASLISSHRDFDSVDENRSLKEEVDGILAFEYLNSRDASSSILPQSIALTKGVNDFSSSYQEGVPNNSSLNSQESIMESIGQVEATNVLVQDFDISVLMEEANEIRNASLMNNNDFLSSGRYIDVVTSLPYLQGGRKKKKPSSIAVVQFIDSDITEVCSSNVKPTVSTRMSKRKRLFLDNESSWEKLTKGVKKHPISKYGDLPSFDVDRKWVIGALELEDEASEEDIFKRMYQLQKTGKIKISKKAIRILGSIRNGGLDKKPAVEI